MPSHPLLVIDIGNTSTAAAVARGRRLASVGRMPTAAATRQAAEAAIRRWTARHPAMDAVVCSVVPAATAIWEAAIRRAIGRRPLRVTHALDLGVRLDYPHPERLGPDRLANACGALFRIGPPVIVADFGTALTVDAVDARGAFIGGVIAPGPALMTDYLAERTALLPRLAWPTGRDAPGPHRAIGANTRAAMLCGARLGYAGMVDAIVRGVRGELRARRVGYCATGGYAARLAAESVWPFRCEPDLTLFGIATIYALNAHTR